MKLQRTAIAFASLGLAMLVGCAAPERRQLSPAPDPPLVFQPREIFIPEPPKKPEPRPVSPEAEWTPRGGIRKGWQVIVVHHSTTPRDTPKSMDEYHRRIRGWSNGLGYHFVIGNGVNYGDGAIYVGSRWKQQIQGAHCAGGAGTYFGVRRPDNFFNEHGIGICLVGNFEKSAPTARQIAALERLITFLCSETGIAPPRIYGHGEVTGKTACPGKILKSRLVQVRRDVARGLAWGGDDYDGDVDLALGLQLELAAAAQAHAGRFLNGLHDAAEFDDVCDCCTLDALDHIADFYADPGRGAVFRDVDDDQAGRVVGDFHAFARLGR